MKKVVLFFIILLLTPAMCVPVQGVEPVKKNNPETLKERDNSSGFREREQEVRHLLIDDFDKGNTIGPFY